MKIAILNLFSGISDRGGETYVKELASEMGKNNEVVICTGEKEVVKNCQIVSIRNKYNPSHLDHQLSPKHVLKRLFLDHSSRQILLFTLTSLPYLLKQKPDIIIAVNSGWQAIISKIFCLLSHTRLVIPGQSGPGLHDRVNLAVRPDLFVCLTNTQKKWAKKHSSKNQKLTVIPNGVNLNRYKPLGKKSKSKTPLVLCVGATIDSKRLDTTIRAVAKSKSMNLLISGTGPLNNQIDKLGEGQLGDRYERVCVSNDKMPSLYQKAEVFTLCSDSTEAFGIVYLEALASNLPVVATDDPSRREIVGDAGIYVKCPEDPKEYSEAIEKAAKNDWGDSLQKQAQKYSWKKIAYDYQSSLSSLLGSKSQSSV